MEIHDDWKSNKPGQRQSDTIFDLLYRKFGTLPDLLLRQIQSLSSAQLDSLAKDLHDFDSVADLQVWLINS